MTARFEVGDLTDARGQSSRLFLRRFVAALEPRDDRLAEDVGLEVERPARRVAGDRREAERGGDQRDLEDVAVDGRDRQAHAVDRDGALGHDVLREVGRALEREPPLARVVDAVDERRDAVDVPLDEVAVDAGADAQGPLDVDVVVRLQQAEVRACDSVSKITSNPSSPGDTSATVRHTPLIATLSPPFTSAQSSANVRRRNFGPSVTPMTRAARSMMPVNMRAV